MLSVSSHTKSSPLTGSTFALSIIVAVILAHRGWCTLDVTWTNPLAGDVYGPGASILGEWQTSAEMSSASFKLCMADDSGAGQDTQDQDPGDSCGAPVQPNVQQDAATGAWKIALAAPNVTERSDYYLMMLDSTGDSATSPIFFLSPVDPDSQTNTSSPASSTTVNAASTNETSSTPHGQLDLMPLMAQTRMPAPTAAYAVPLALAGAIILFASALGIHHHRKLVQERAAEKAHLAETQPSDRRFGLHSRSSSVKSAGSEKSWDRRSGGSHARGVDEEKDIYTRMYVPHLADRGRYAMRHGSGEGVTGRPDARGVAGHTATGRVSAAVFKAAASPRVGAHQTEPLRTRGVDEANASVNDDVLDHYLRPSPVAPFPGEITTPMQAHVRKSASPSPSVHRLGGDSSVALYEEVQRKLYD